MSSWVQHDLIYKAICAGATGYVNKFGDKKDLINAVHEVANGNAQLSLPIARLIQSDFSDLTFSSGQLQIIKLIATGFSQNHVAASLQQTVDVTLKQVRRIYKRLQSVS